MEPQGHWLDSGNIKLVITSLASGIISLPSFSDSLIETRYDEKAQSETYDDKKQRSLSNSSNFTYNINTQDHTIQHVAPLFIDGYGFVQAPQSPVRPGQKVGWGFPRHHPFRTMGFSLTKTNHCNGMPIAKMNTPFFFCTDLLMFNDLASCSLNNLTVNMSLTHVVQHECLTVCIVIYPEFYIENHNFTADS